MKLQQLVTWLSLFSLSLVLALESSCNDSEPVNEKLQWEKNLEELEEEMKAAEKADVEKKTTQAIELSLESRQKEKKSEAKFARIKRSNALLNQEIQDIKAGALKFFKDSIPNFSQLTVKLN